LKRPKDDDLVKVTYTGGHITVEDRQYKLGTGQAPDGKWVVLADPVDGFGERLYLSNEGARQLRSAVQ
jgi:hypothetical protein